MDVRTRDINAGLCDHASRLRVDPRHRGFTDDGKVDIIKMHDSDAVPNPPVTNDLLTATMEDGRVRAKFYSNPANPLAPSAADQIYESLGFELTKGYSAAGSDKRATSGVDASLLAWDGVWAEI